MSHESTDRNLLFGVLALQADLLTAARFAEACTAWSARKDVSLADLLVERGWITPTDRSDISKLLDRKLRKHGGDVRASLAEAAGPAVHASLAGIKDRAIQRSLIGLPGPATIDRGASSHELLSTIGYHPESRERYTLTRLHAKGGIGQVWLARDSDLGREVALKEIRPEQPEVGAVRNRFLAEARITGQLEHPNIVPVYELVRPADGGRPFYTMRFVRGRTLSEAVKDYHRRLEDGTTGPLELRQLLDAFVDVCNAVAYAHSRGVIHRDLKGANIVLGDFGEVMLLDWGLAKVLGQPGTDKPVPLVTLEKGTTAEQTVQGQVLGTPAYMAPEQAAGRLDQIHEWTDVYGLGAILYEILAGRVPFSGEDTTDVLRKVQHEPPIPPRILSRDVPKALQAICLKAMAKNPKQRYTRADDLARDVQHWLADEPVEAYREPVVARVNRWFRGHKAVVAGALGLLITAIVSLSVGLFMMRSAKHEIEKQSNLAEQRLHEVEKQSILAEQRLQETQKALLQGWEQVEMTMANSPIPGLEPLRKELYQGQLRYVDQPPDIQARYPELIKLAPRKFFEYGKLCRDVGTQREALDALTKARDGYQDLLRAKPDDSAYKDNLSRVHAALGQVYLLTGRPAEAVEPFRQCVTIADGLLRAVVASRRGSGIPGDATAGWTYREMTAWNFTYLGIAQRRVGQIEEAAQSFRRGLQDFRELAKEPYRTINIYPYFPNGLGFCLFQLGQFQHEMGRTAEALKSYEEAVQHCREAIRLHLQKPRPDNKATVQFRSVLGHALGFLGTLHLEADRLPEAQKALEESLALLREVYHVNPSLLAIQARLATAHANLGYLHLQAGKLDEAERAFRDAIEVADRLTKGPAGTAKPEGGDIAVNVENLATLDAQANPDFMDGQAAALAAHRGLGLVRLKQGRHDDARAALKEALAAGAVVAPHAPIHRIGFASAQALAGVAVGQGKPQLTDAEQDEKRRLTDQALATLRQAVAAGWGNADSLRRDPAFESVRARAEFQRIIQEVEAKAKAFAAISP